MVARNHMGCRGAGRVVGGLAGWALFTLAAPAAADVKTGEEAWNRGDYAAAVQQWQGPSDQGDPDAQFHLAQAYRLGRGVPRDLVRAEALFAQAAAKGHLEAADFYGLMMFDRGDRAAAMPYVRAAAERGDARAQYLMGIAHFNGDLAPKDWVRAYALMTLAQSAGLPQASGAIVQMDQHIPLPQRQSAATLAARLGEQAQANRAAQLAAQDLGGKIVRNAPIPAPASAPASAIAATPPPPPVAGPNVAAVPVTTEAPKPPTPALTAAPPPPEPKPAAAQTASTKPIAAKPVPPKTVSAKPAPAAAGIWRVQLGAFGVAANADVLWARVKSRPELAGHPRINARAGSATKLQAGGFASKAAASQACARLTAAGYACLPVTD